MSSAGPSSPTAADGNSHFGFSDQSSVNTHMTEENQGLGLLQGPPGDGTQEFPAERQQELVEPNQSPQEPPVEVSPLGGQDVAEVSQTCQEVPDTTQTCHDILEEVGQPNQEVPDISQLFLKNRDTAANACQPCQKVHEEVCQRFQDNPEENDQLCQEAHGSPVGVGSMVQETFMEIGRPAQEIPEEISPPRQEFSVEVGMLAPEVPAIIELSQDIPETDKPSPELTEETGLQAQEVSEETDEDSRMVPEVVDELPSEEIPQGQGLSSDVSTENQSLAHAQHSSPTSDV